MSLALAAEKEERERAQVGRGGTRLLGGGLHVPKAGGRLKGGWSAGHGLPVTWCSAIRAGMCTGWASVHPKAKVLTLVLPADVAPPCSARLTT